MFQRHNTPVGTYVWPERKTEHAMDIEVLEAQAVASLKANVKDKGAYELNLYVTGLSPALIAVLNAATILDIDVWAYHYDQRTGGYVEQKILRSLN
jgi:hypothetical protein